MALADEGVVAEVVAVVGGEDEDGVVEDVALAELVDDLADLVIDLEDERGVVGADAEHLVAGELGVVDAVPGALVPGDVLSADAGGVAGIGNGLGKEVPLDPLEELGSGIVRTVGTGEADHHGEGPFGAVLGDEAARFEADVMIGLKLEREAVDDGALLVEVTLVLVAVVLALAVRA